MTDEYGIDPVERDDQQEIPPPPQNGSNGHVDAVDPEPFTYEDLDARFIAQAARGAPPELRKKVTDALRLGLTERLAAQYAGIQFEEYIKIRRRDKDFASAIKQAMGQGAFVWMARIEQAAAGGDWRAAAWKLAHVFPSEYGRQVLEHSGEGGGAIPVRFVTVEVPQGHAEQISEGPDMPPLPEPDLDEDDGG